MDKISILLVDDELDMLMLLNDFLVEHHFDVYKATNTTEAEALLEKEPDVLLLDVKMPGEDGISFCRRMREKLKCPIIFLTAVDDQVEEVVAHEVGADDYLVKPYQPRILLAKIKAILRRYNINKDNATADNTSTKRISAYCFADWILNIERRELIKSDNSVFTLSKSESCLLLAFVENAGRILTREFLLNSTQDHIKDVFDRSIDVLISRLRKKLSIGTENETIIKTVRGSGYLFTPKVTKQYA